MKKRLIGKIVSNKMKNTVVVRTVRLLEHPKYKKRYKKHKNYKAHIDSEAEYKKGETVLIEECRPLSKDKKWKVIKKI